MKKEEMIAEEVFQQYGLNFQTAVRAGGWTNAVWLNGDFALRVSLKRGNDRIGREVQLSKLLPKEVSYPQNIQTGMTDGFEWSLSKRVSGQPLSEVWDSLKWAQRISAVRQIVDIVRYVHTVDIGKAEFWAKKTAWYNEFSIEKSLADIERYIEQRLLTDEQGCQMRKILKRFYQAHFTAKPVLNHGDITMDNLLWHEGNVVSLMDFEHSVIAPPELDIHSLVNLAFLPTEDRMLTCNDGDETSEYLDAVSKLITPLFSRPESADLILGYSILYRQRFFEFWLDNPKGELAQVDAYVKLCSLIDGNKGYLSSILQ